MTSLQAMYNSKKQKTSLIHIFSAHLSKGKRYFNKALSDWLMILDDQFFFI